MAPQISGKTFRVSQIFQKKVCGPQKILWDPIPNENEHSLSIFSGFAYQCIYFSVILSLSPIKTVKKLF